MERALRMNGHEDKCEVNNRLFNGGVVFDDMDVVSYDCDSFWFYTAPNARIFNHVFGH